MLKWFFKLMKNIFTFIFTEKKSQCSAHCITCKYWDECCFLQDISGEQSAMKAGYESGYKDGVSDTIYNRTKL